MDSFFGIGIMELFFIAIIALVVLGPERLPGAIREVSKWMRTIRNLSNELTSQFSEEMKAFDDINPQKILRELTEEPLEDINKTTGATKPAAKPGVKPVAKTTPAKATPAKTTPAKTTPAKTTPAKTTPAKPATATSSTASSTASSDTTAGATAGAATKPGGINSTKNITPPPPKKPAPPSVAAQPNEAGKAEDAVAPEGDGAAPSEADNRILPPTADAPPAANPGAGAEETPASDRPQDDKIRVDAAASHPAIAVNGKSASADEEA